MCPIRVSHKSVKQECLTRVLRNSVKQECPMRVLNQCVMSGRTTNMSMCIAFLPQHTCQHSGLWVSSCFPLSTHNFRNFDIYLLFSCLAIATELYLDSVLPRCRRHNHFWRLGRQKPRRSDHCKTEKSKLKKKSRVWSYMIYVFWFYIGVFFQEIVDRNWDVEPFSGPCWAEARC